MGKYSDYNIIPLGDHCATSLILKELNIRQKSYPFDWNASTDLLYDTTIITNVSFIDELNKTEIENIDEILKKYIGDALDNKELINKNLKITFPHDVGCKKENYEKYKRRFIRLKEDLNKKNLFVILTRYYFIEKDIFEKIKENLLSYNNESIILFISGKNHEYFDENHENNENVIFKHINYDISKFYQYDYTHFRPNIKKYLSEILL